MCLCSLLLISPYALSLGALSPKVGEAIWLYYTAPQAHLEVRLAFGRRT